MDFFPTIESILKNVIRSKALFEKQKSIYMKRLEVGLST